MTTSRRILSSGARLCSEGRTADERQRLMHSTPLDSISKWGTEREGLSSEAEVCASRLWLAESKGKVFGDLSEKETKKFFSKFVDKWNDGELLSPASDLPPSISSACWCLLTLR